MGTKRSSILSLTFAGIAAVPMTVEGGNGKKLNEVAPWSMARRVSICFQSAELLGVHILS